MNVVAVVDVDVGVEGRGYLSVYLI